ncbi:MAG: AMP-binding protein [Bacteroidia bacterium]
MLKLLTAAIANPYLSYLDVNRNKEFRMNDLLVKEDIHRTINDKSVSFLYTDNSISSIAAFWNFYSSKSVIVLLSNQLHDSLKVQLEEIYLPEYIFDLNRAAIKNYISVQIDQLIFHKRNNCFLNKNIHPDVKILLSTSGTTGSPKFVKLSDENFYQNALSIIDYLPINKNDVTPLNLSINYSYGLSILTTNSIAGGQIICSLDDILNKTFWENFEKYGFTSLAGVPYTYEVLNRIGFTQKKHPTLKYLTQAGGKLSNKLISLFADFSTNNSIPLYIMYGQTEATARMSYLQPDMISNKLGSIGKPIKNGAFSIEKDTNELMYSGPNIFGGYAECINDLSTFDINTKLRTGDVAKVDEQGYYYITGRIKRFAKILGSRINLDELEAQLKDNFDNITFICLGLNDKSIFIGFTDPDLSDNEIREYIKDKFKIHHSFIKIKFIEHLPLTANGKINYSELSRLYEHL